MSELFKYSLEYEKLMHILNKMRHLRKDLVL